MGAMISFLIKGVIFATKKIMIPLIKIMTYVMAVCFVFCVISNLAGLFGLIIFMMVFYYYVKGIIFIEPGGGGTGNPMQAINTMLPATNAASMAAKATASGMATAAVASTASTASTAMKGVATSIPSIVKK
jgi:hypothetical protein